LIHFNNNVLVMKYIKFKFLTFVIILLFIIVSIFLCELVLRVIGLGDPVIHQTSPVWRYSLAANQTKKRFNNNIVKVNSAGLRANSEWVKKKDNKLILILGDSVTYGGSKIDNNQLFSEKLCKHLGQEFTCGNAGINGYGVLNMVLRSRYDKRIANADIVIFVVILQDFWRGLVDIGLVHYFTSDPNKILSAMEEALNYVGWRYDINRYLAHKTKPNTNKSSEKNDLENQIFYSSEYALQNLNQEIKRLMNENKKVFVFYSPSKSDIYNGPSEFRKKMKNKILNETLNIYDMTSDFENSSKLKIYVDNSHYDIEGHSLVSDIMHDHLVKN